YTPNESSPEAPAASGLFCFWSVVSSPWSVVDEQRPPTTDHGQRTTDMRSIQIYDTTLRDGTQGEGVSLSLQDKLQITQRLDEIGVDFVEGGYPASNTKDSEYFSRARELKLSHAKICAFGMTRRRGTKAASDLGIQTLVAAETPVVTIVGKTWDF